jgi:ABC-type transport system substrate-binding protein
MYANKRLMIALGLIVSLSMILAACAQQPAVIQTVVVQGTPMVITATPGPTEEAVTNPLIGSGQLDGNGIPPDFFSDIHVRKAFNYCFDWDTYIKDVFQGDAVQSYSVIIPGMLGYDPNGKHYSFDPDQCTAEMKQAWDGKVWDTGFRVQIAYNIGNTTRQTVAEILAENLAAINDKFVIETIGLPWPAFLQAQRDKRLPVFISGWLEDIHDPHNWVVPYLIGTYGIRQSMPADMAASFKKLIDQGIQATDPAKRQAIYYQLNDLVYENVPDILLAVPLGTRYYQPWVKGWYYNPVAPDDFGDWYAASKDASAPNGADTLVYATFGAPETLDPALNYETAGAGKIQNVYQTLVYYNRQDANTVEPQLASDWTISDDGLTYTFNIRKGIKFHEGQDLTPSDVAYSFQRGLLYGGTASPQWLLYEPFFGVDTFSDCGYPDISCLVDPTGAMMDDSEALKAADPAKLQETCKKVQDAVVADDAAGTVTMHLAQPWGPFLVTIAQGWGSVMSKEWTIAQGGWDGSCDTWQNSYAVSSESDPLSKVMNGTGPFKFDHWTEGEELVFTRNDNYWRDAATGPLYEGGPVGPAKLAKVVVKQVDEWGTRFAMLQAGDADFVIVNPENRPQVDPLVGTTCNYDDTTKDFNCEKTGDGTLVKYRGYPQVTRTDVFFNFNIVK